MKLRQFASLMMCGGLFAISVPAQAGGVTGNLAFASDYMLRGYSQTSEQVAIQGGLTYSFDSGFFGSVWGSSVAYGLTGGTEFDLTAGYGGKVSDLGYEAGLIAYNYPGYNTPNDGIPDYNFKEVYAKLMYAGFTAGINYSPNYFGHSGRYHWLFLEYNKDLGPVAIAAHIARNQFENHAATIKAAFPVDGNGDSYLDYRFGVSKTLNGLTYDLSYVGSNTPSAVCGGTCIGRPVFTLTKSF